MEFISEWNKIKSGSLNNLIHCCRSFIHPENNHIYILYCRSFIKNIWDFCFWREKDGKFIDFEILKNNFKIIEKNITVQKIAENLLNDRFN